MNPLESTFTAGQLAVFLLVCVAVLTGLGKWALSQFKQSIEDGFQGLRNDIQELKKDIVSRPTRVEMDTEVRAIHRRIDDHFAPPRRRITDVSDEPTA